MTAYMIPETSSTTPVIPTAGVILGWMGSESLPGAAPTKSAIATQETLRAY